MEQIRRKVKVLQEKSKLVVNALERGRNDIDKQKRQAVKRQYKLEVESVRLQKEVERLKAELDVSFPDTSFSDCEPSTSQKPDEIEGSNGSKQPF
jgi:hypothetical protein